MVLLDDVFPWSSATFRTDSFVALVDSAGCLGSATMGESPLTTSNCLALRIKRENASVKETSKAEKYDASNVTAQNHKL